MPVKLMGVVPIKLGGAPSVVGGAPNEVGGVLVEAGGTLVEAGGAPFKEVGWGPNRLVDGELVSKNSIKCQSHLKSQKAWSIDQFFERLV